MVAVVRQRVQGVITTVLSKKLFDQQKRAHPLGWSYFVVSDVDFSLYEGIIFACFLILLLSCNC